jgi:hypothetical protein
LQKARPVATGFGVKDLSVPFSWFSAKMRTQHPLGLNKPKWENLDPDLKVEDEPLDQDEPETQAANRLLLPIKREVQQSDYGVDASHGVPGTAFGESRGSCLSTQPWLGPHHAVLDRLSADGGVSSSHNATDSSFQTSGEARDSVPPGSTRLSDFFEQLMDASDEDEVSEHLHL